MTNLRLTRFQIFWVSKKFLKLQWDKNLSVKFWQMKSDGGGSSLRWFDSFNFVILALSEVAVKWLLIKIWLTVNNMSIVKLPPLLKRWRRYFTQTSSICSSNIHQPASSSIIIGYVMKMRREDNCYNWSKHHRPHHYVIITDFNDEVGAEIKIHHRQYFLCLKSDTDCLTETHILR